MFGKSRGAASTHTESASFRALTKTLDRMSAIGGAIGLVVMLVSAAAHVWVCSPTWSKYGLAFGAGSLLGVGAMYGIAKIVNARADRNPPRYRQKSVEFTYSFDHVDPSLHTDTTCIELEFLEPGVDHIPYRYRWTGGGNEDKPVVRTHGLQLLGPVETDPHCVYFLYLGRTYAPTETLKYEIDQVLKDTGANMKPRYGYGARVPLDSLTITVNFAPTRSPVPGTVRAIETTLEPPWESTRLWAELTPRNSGLTFSYHWPSPPVGRRMAVVWEWPAQALPVLPTPPACAEAASEALTNGST